MQASRKGELLQWEKTRVAYFTLSSEWRTITLYIHDNPVAAVGARIMNGKAQYYAVQGYRKE